MIQPEEWLRHAKWLVLSAREADEPDAFLRRAVSTAYYSVFHQLVRDATDNILGRTKRLRPEYSLVYRSFEHAKLKKTCQDLANKLASLNVAEISPKLVSVARAFVNLQKQRHKSDYDIGFRLTHDDAVAQVAAARQAIRDLKDLKPSEYKAFLLLLAFTQRD